MRARDRELHALVLADRPAEHDALLGVVGGAADEELGIAQALRGDQDALGVHAVDDVAEALALLADQVLGRHLQVVEEHLAGVVVDHGVDLLDLDALALGLAQVDEEHREPLGALLHLVGGRGAGQQQHQVGLQHAAGPDLLAVDDVAVVALLLGPRLELGGVGAGGGLGDAEGLQPQRAGGDARQVFLLLRRIAVPQHRAHRVHLGVAGRRVAARLVHGLQDGAAGRQRQPGAAVLLRDQRAEIAGLGEGIDELGRVGALVVELDPVGIGELLADVPHALADLVPAGIEGDRDGSLCFPTCLLNLLLGSERFPSTIPDYEPPFSGAESE